MISKIIKIKMKAIFNKSISKINSSSSNLAYLTNNKTIILISNSNYFYITKPIENKSFSKINNINNDILINKHHNIFENTKISGFNSLLFQINKKQFSEKAKPKKFYKESTVEETHEEYSHVVYPPKDFDKNVLALLNNKNKDYLTQLFFDPYHNNKVNYKIKLDKKFLKTRHLEELICPNLNIALAISEEWIDQEKIVNHYEMHFNTYFSSGVRLLLNQDKLDEAIDRIIPYFFNDQLQYCSSKELKKVSELYKLELLPKALDINDTCLDIFGFNFDLNWLDKEDISSSVAEVKLSEQDKVNKIKQILYLMNPFIISVIVEMVSYTKSLSVSLGLLLNKVDYREAYYISHSEELFQMIEHGEVEGHHDLLHLNLQSKLLSSKVFFELLKEDNKL